MIECRKCNGKGFNWVMHNGQVEKDMCLACNGQGYFEDDEDGGEDDSSEVFDYQEPNPEDR